MVRLQDHAVLKHPSVSIVYRTLEPNLSLMVESVERFAGQADIDETTALRLQLILEELITNALTHGRTEDVAPRVEINLWRDDSLLKIEVADNGRAYDPLMHPPPDLDSPLEERPIGGLGIHLMREYTESAEYQRYEGRNVLRLAMQAARPPVSPEPLTDR